MKSVYKKFNIVLDPHSAIGYGAFDKINLDGNNIVLATAHPCKFPDAIKKAINLKADLPKELMFVMEEKENYDIIDNDVEKIQATYKRKNLMNIKENDQIPNVDFFVIENGEPVKKNTQVHY